MVYRRKLRTVRKRRAVRKRAPARRRRLQPKINSLIGQTLGAAAISNIYNRVQNYKSRGRPKGSAKDRARAGVVTGNDHDYTGGSLGGEWTKRYQSGKFGSLTARKIDKISLDKTILTHRRLGPFNDYGQYFMTNFKEANGNLQLPMLLFELNSTKNNVNGTITTHAPVRKLYQNDTGQINWLEVFSQVPDGTLQTTADWVVERSAHNTNQTITYPGDNAIHLWSSLDLELWGCRNKPTKYDIMLCQFSEDVLPDYGTQTGNAAEFWQSLIKPFSYSPLAKMESGFNKKKMKILKHYLVSLDATTTIENDPDPAVKQLKLFYRFNRKANFQWKYANAAGQTVANMNDADWQQEDAENQSQVHPNARIYVMIRASNYTRIDAPAAVDNTTCPSVSWRMRTAYLINQ